MLTSVTSLFLLATSAAAFDVSGLPREHQRLAASIGRAHPLIARVGHKVLDALTVDQVAEALGDGEHKQKIFAAKRAGLAARGANKRQSSAFDPTECKPTGIATAETLTSAGLETEAVEGSFDHEAYFLVNGPATIFVEPRFAPQEASTFGDYDVSVFDTSCYSSPTSYYNGTAIEITTNGTVGVQLAFRPSTCDSGFDLGFSLDPEEASSDCESRTTFTFGVALGETESECSDCLDKEYCSTDGACTCDNYAAACFNRDDCPAMDPGFDSDGECHTGYNAKACCTAEGANKAITSMAASLSLVGVDVNDAAYSDCWEQVMRPLYCAEKCLADSSVFSEEGDLVQCKSLCEKTIDLCKAFIEQAADGEGPAEDVDASACAEQPTEDCFAGAGSMVLSGLVSVAALLSLA
jgi:hypothetical protein